MKRFLIDKRAKYSLILLFFLLIIIHGLNLFDTRNLVTLDGITVFLLLGIAVVLIFI